MVPYKIIKIKKKKTIYKVEISDSKGNVKDQWLDLHGINFIDPYYFNGSNSNEDSPQITQRALKRNSNDSIG